MIDPPGRLVTASPPAGSVPVTHGNSFPGDDRRDAIWIERRGQKADSGAIHPAYEDCFGAFCRIHDGDEVLTALLRSK